MRKILSIVGLTVASLALLVPTAQAQAGTFINSPYSEYSVRIWNNSSCSGTNYIDLRRGYTKSNWVSSYKIYSSKGSATYGGHTYSRSRGVCYQTNVSKITVKAWD